MTCDLEQLEKLLAWRLQGYVGHVDFDDLKQECRIAAWRAVENHMGQASRNRLMIAAIECEAVDFLRSPMNRERKWTRAGNRRVLPVTLDYDEYKTKTGGVTHRVTGGWPYPEPEPCMPDFVGPLLDWLEGVRIWALRGKALKAGEAALLAALVLDGRSVAALAKEQGRSESAVFAEKKRALERYRAWLLGTEEAG